MYFISLRKSTTKVVAFLRSRLFSGEYLNMKYEIQAVPEFVTSNLGSTWIYEWSPLLKRAVLKGKIVAWNSFVTERV